MTVKRDEDLEREEEENDEYDSFCFMCGDAINHKEIAGTFRGEFVDFIARYVDDDFDYEYNVCERCYENMRKNVMMSWEDAIKQRKSKTDIIIRLKEQDEKDKQEISRKERS